MTTTLKKASISAEELDDILERGEPFLLLDVRNEETAQQWPLQARRPVQTLNIPYFAFDVAEEECCAQIPSDTSILVMCNRGRTAEGITESLLKRGYQAAKLEGGMSAWGKHYRVREIPNTGADLNIYQLSRVARGDLVYIVRSGDEAIVIDPTRHIDELIALSEKEGFRIIAALDTHAHADHISGGPELAKRLGIPYYLHPYDGIHPIDMLPATIEYERLWDGFTLSFGTSHLRGIHIPGHTLGNMAFLVNDRFLFTGDSIFIRSIARPDLGGKGETWAPLHYHSLYHKLLTLPDETVVLPAHFGQPSEAQPDGSFWETLGNMKRNNPELQFKDKETFVNFLLENLPVFPPQYVEIKRVNAGLLIPDAEKADELELGQNVCALSSAYK